MEVPNIYIIYIYIRSFIKSNISARCDVILLQHKLSIGEWPVDIRKRGWPHSWQRMTHFVEIRANLKTFFVEFSETTRIIMKKKKSRGLSFVEFRNM